MNKKSIPFFLVLIGLALGAWLFLQHGVETGKKTAANSAVEDAPAAESSQGEEAAKAAPTPPAPIDPATVGTVRGVVSFVGVAPERRPIFLSGFADCKALQGTPALEESLVVENGKIRHALVFVRKGLEGREFPLSEDITAAKPAVMDQVACIYTPHVLALRAGQPVEILNSDSLLHNVHSDSKRNPSFNLPMPRKGDKIERKFDKPEIFSLRCDVHSWMKSYIGVFAHPYFQVTAADGAFALQGLPPGKYTIRAWHESLGTQDIEIELLPKEEKAIEFKLKKP